MVTARTGLVGRRDRIWNLPWASKPGPGPGRPPWRTATSCVVAAS